MAYSLIEKVQYISLFLFVLVLFIFSNYYSDRFFEVMVNFPFRVDPLIFRFVLGVVAGYFFLIIFHQLSHKHPWGLSFLVFLSFLLSPSVVKNALLLYDPIFFIITPLVVLSYLMFRYNHFYFGMLFMVISLLDIRSAVAYIPMLLMHYVKFRDVRVLFLFGLLAFLYLIFNPTLSFNPKDVGMLLVFASLSLAFFENIRPMVGFIFSLPFLNNPYVVFPLLVVSMDVVDYIFKGKRMHRHFAIFLFSFLAVFYLLWGIELSKVVSVSILTAFVVFILSYLLRDDKELFYALLFLSVLAEVALSLSFLSNVELYAIDYKTIVELSSMDIDSSLGSAYFYTYMTGKELNDPKFVEGEKILITLYNVYKLYPNRFSTSNVGNIYPFGEHRIVYIPSGYTKLDRAFDGVIVYASPSAVVVRH